MLWHRRGARRVVEESVLQVLYQAVIDCPETQGRSMLRESLESELTAEVVGALEKEDIWVTNERHAQELAAASLNLSLSTFLGDPSSFLGGFLSQLGVFPIWDLTLYVFGAAILLRRSKSSVLAPALVIFPEESLVSALEDRDARIPAEHDVIARTWVLNPWPPWHAHVLVNHHPLGKQNGLGGQ